jgi:beta-lactam-binding protein with PASTA domain
LRNSVIWIEAKEIAYRNAHYSKVNKALRVMRMSNQQFGGSVQRRESTSSWLRICGVASLFASLVFTSAINAAEHRYDVLLDLDQNAATGCAIDGIAGIERVIRATVNTTNNSASVTAIEQLQCNGSLLGAPTPLAGAPYALTLSPPASTAIELSLPLVQLPPQQDASKATLIRLAAVSRAADGGSDALAPPVNFQLYAATPNYTWPHGITVPTSTKTQTATLSIFLLAIACIAIFRHRRLLTHTATTTLLSCCIIFTAFGIGTTRLYAIVVDGLIGDWVGTTAIIVDPVGDRPSNADLVALYAKVEADALALRIDARIEYEPAVSTNQPPAIGALSDVVIALPEHRVAFAPTVSDDGLPAPSTVSYQWQMVSGPKPVAFGAALDQPPIIFTAAQALAAQQRTTRDAVAFFDATQPGVYVLRFTASDGAQSSFRDVRVTVNAVADAAPAIGPFADRRIGVGNTLSLSLAARDNDPAATLRYSLVTAPNGATLNPPHSPRFVFTPTRSQVGVHPVTLQVTDDRGQTATASFTIAVFDRNRVPSLVQPPDATLPAGTIWRYTLAASDPDGDSLQFELASGPANMTLTGAELQWTPNAAQIGTHPVVVGVRDSNGLASAKGFTLRVAANAAPVARDDRYEVQAGASLQVSASNGVLANDVDADGDSLEARKRSDPDRGSLRAFNPDGSFRFDAPSVAPMPDLAWQLRVLFANVGSLGAAPLVGDVNGDGYPDLLQHNLNADIGANSGRDGARLFSLNLATDGDCSRWLGAGEQRVWADLDDSGKLTYVMTVICARDSNSLGDRILAFDETGAVKWLSPPLSMPHPDKRVGNTPVPPGGFPIGSLAHRRGLSAARLTANSSPVLLLRGAIVTNDGTTNYQDANNTFRQAGCRAVTGNAADEGRACRFTLIVDARNGTVLQRLIAPNPSNTRSANGPSALQDLPPIAYDINGDGRIDIVSGPEVFLQNASGGFDLAWQLEQPVNDTAVADLDGDGSPEIVHLRASGHPTSLDAGVFIYRADGSLRVRIPLHGFYLVPLSIADVDGDGRSDILVGVNGILFAIRDDGRILWAHRPDTETPTDPIFGPHWGYNTEPARLQASVPQVYDLNGDGINEVIVGADGRTLVLDGRTGKQALPSRWTFYRAGIDNIAAMRVIDFDNDGEVEIFSTGNIAFNCLFVGFPAGACNTIIGPIMKAQAGTTWQPGPKIYPQLQYRESAFTDLSRIVHDTSVSPRFRNPAQRGNIADPARAIGTRFEYEARDGGSTSIPAAVTIVIHPDNRPPSFTSTPPSSFHQRNQTPPAQGAVIHRYQPSAVDPDPGDIVSYSIKSAPSWVTMQQPSGLMSFAPPCGSCDVGWITVLITATDSRGASTDQLIVVNLTTEAVIVPNVVGRARDAALEALRAAGLTGIVEDEIHNAAPVGEVLSQVAAAATSTGRFDVIRLTISKGPAALIVPNVIGLDETQARRRLEALGFTAQVSYRFDAASPSKTVLEQSLAPGSLAQPSAISLTVSAGSGLRLHLNRDVMRADSSIQARPEALDVAGSVIGNPAVTYTITAVQADATGPLPTIANHRITASPTTRGVFRVSATDSSNRVATREFIVLPPQSIVWEEVITRVIAIEDLTPQVIAAIEANDIDRQRQLLQTIVSIWTQPLPGGMTLPDRLPNATLLQLDSGFAPSACTQRTFTRNPTLADLLQQARNRNLNDRIQNLISQLQDPNGLRRDLEIELDALREAVLSLKDAGSLSDAPSGLSELETLQWAASQGVDSVMNGLMDQARAVLDPGNMSFRKGRKTNFAELTVTTTLQGIVSAIGEQTLGPIRQTVYRGLRQAAFSAAAIQANNWLRETLKGQAIDGVVTGASASFHTFGLPNSFIEVPGCIGDARNYTVLFVGPDLLESVIELIEKIKEGVSFDRNELFNELKWRNPFGRDLIRDDISNRLREIRGAVNGVADAVIAAWQGPNDTDFGCIFGTGPACQQLIFNDGISPVYTLQYGQNPPFPAAILTIVFDNAYGDVFIGTPLFFPVRKGLFE